MDELLLQRKVSHRVYEELKAEPWDVKIFLKGGPPPKCPRGKKGVRPVAKVIISKAAEVTLAALVKELESLKIKISGYADSFVFAEVNEENLQNVANLKEVDRVFLDEKVRAMLEDALQTTKASAVWRVFKSHGEGITWAVVDAGINDRHPHFASSEPSPPPNPQYPSWWDPDFEKKDWFKQLNLGGRIGIQPLIPGNTVALRINQVSRSTRKDPHGTHIAGIIAGKDPQREEFGGLAPRANLVDFQVLDERREGPVSSVINALNLIRKINEENNEIVIAGANLSLGYPYNFWDFGCGGSPLCQAVDQLVHSGVVVVVAAGNEGYRQFTAKESTHRQEGEEQLFDRYTATKLFTFQSIADPGNARLAITVGATHRRNPHYWGPSFFSSRGPTGDGRLKPDLLAPGEKITSCNVNFQANPYSTMSGTSQAAAMVSGALALFLSIQREFIGRPLEVKEELLKTCTDLGRERYHQGCGLLDILRLAQSV
jgi:serine protease AprX